MNNTPSTRFRDLAIGDTFDFVDDSRPGYNSFFARCTKTSSRSYTWRTNVGRQVLKTSVGTINVRVYHVEAAR